jgi:hypothetical protein
MPATRICTIVSQPTDLLWRQLSEYGTWHTWLGQLAESYIEGSENAWVPIGTTRAVGPRGNPWTRETLVGCDDTTRTLRYQVAEEPEWRFPARHYVATVRLFELTEQEGTAIDWSSRYDCDRADETFMNDLLTDLYRGFINDLVVKVARYPEA